MTKVVVHQVGFIPLYLPFYVAVHKVVENLGWELEYHVGIADEDNIKRACRFKLNNKNEIHIVLTALHNLKVVREKDDSGEDKLCKNCNHKNNVCNGVDENMDWFFPWIFVIKLPVYVFLKGEINNKDIKSKVEKVGVRRQLTWEDIKELLNSGVKIYIYPEGATINDAVLNHIFREEKKENVENIDFDIEKDQKKKIDQTTEPALVFTLNPHLYENDPKYKLIMKPPHNFFPFTGIAFPCLKETGASTEEMKLLYHLEREYINFMTYLQENLSPFFEQRRVNVKDIKKWLKEEIQEALLNKIEKYRVYEGESDKPFECRKLSIDVDRFCESFMDLYEDGVFRESTENVVVDYLREKTSTIVAIFDPEIYKARVRDAVAYVFARNLSHVYGSNVIPYIITDHLRKRYEEVLKQLKNSLQNTFKNSLWIGTLQKYGKNIAKFLEFLQERMDYLATIVSDNSISPYAFMEVKLRDLIPSFITYEEFPFNYLYKRKGINVDLNINKDENSLSFEVGVPPILYDQAICSIFENILRNSAKYGKITGGKLNFEIEAEEITTSEGEKFIKVTIVDENVDPSKKEEVKNDLNRRFKRALVDPYLNINYKEWGLKEVKISCAYLRGIPLEEIDLKGESPQEGSPPIISVVPKEKGIGFEFYLYPYKKILEIEDLKDSKKGIPCEFMIVKKQGEDSDILCERKYTRIFLEEESKDDWKYYATEWIRNLHKMENINIVEYYLVGGDDYNKFYKELSNRTINENEIIIAYVRHLSLIGEKDLEKLLKKIKEISPYSYIHSFKGQGLTYRLAGKAVNGDEFIKYKLRESALLRVLILDERVQNRVNNNYKNIELKSLNVYVPKTSLEKAIRDEETFNALKEELEVIQKKYNPHVTVVHVSLLEQADKNLKDLGEKVFKNNILDGILKNSDIILTTGRGKITSNYRDIYGEAIPISHILKVFEGGTVNKYILSNMIIGFNRNLILNRYRKSNTIQL